MKQSTRCMALPLLCIAISMSASAVAAGGSGGGGGGGSGGGGGTAPAAVVVTREAQLLAAHAEDHLLPLDSLGTSPQALSGETAAFLASGPAVGTGTRKLVVYRHNPATGAWSKEAELRPDPLDATGFASSIALEGDILVAAVYNPTPVSFDPNAQPRGVYVYHRSGATWSLEGRLVGGDASTDTFLYGFSVAVSGNRVLVGASGGVHFNGTVKPDSRHGAIYEFDRAVAANGIVKWQQAAKLASAAKATPDLFGASMAFNGSTLVIGGQANNLFGGANTVAVYQRGATAWPARPSAILRPADLTAASGNVQHGIGFGGAVGISGDTLVIGGASDVSGKVVNGAGYIFQRTAGVWAQQAKLVPKARSDRDHFAGRVSNSGDLALFGYRPDGASAGRVSLFKRVGTAWAETSIASPGIPVEVADKVDNFGLFALVSGSAAVVSQSWATLSREWVYRFK